MHKGKDALLPHHQSDGRSNKARVTKQNCIWTFMLIIETVIYGSYSTLVNLGKENGKLPFKSGSVVLLIEFTKLVTSCVLYIPEFVKGGYRLPKVPLISLISFSVPAVLYMFNNNVALYMQLQMDPTTFQVLNNLKIATTALLYKLIIKREITRPQWIALGLLTLAGICDSYGGFVEQKLDHHSLPIFITVTGLLMMFMYCSISGFAAVFTEYLLKKRKSTSLPLQNILLYAYGTFLNALTLLWQTNTYEGEDKGFFQGFTVYTWLIVLTQASNGLIMSVVMKHGSNLTRLFIISGGMLTSTILSVFVFGTVINVFFIIAAMLVVSAIFLYHH
ncbi:probable UDP-sugar transporter protein SLC35A4 [Ruditapes philippinarum]|uniref:probable UDP-sugar transporter protein SLC35A4 n=1 Tax=Ruditapes philippinarum TaxID=129788 RepID=UPI00295B0E8C|nr:probable UDP-sugar transporter protein SLC35A4 [Ruditapes philippinarum]XP_060607230.1 probable UDP-sugar transporter protein SLC35A4 [Ruditapes philippinarum]XP_060607232.1 probable UDP-sugar transporter protein SLC35A4 [Ruditapes philippinarum]